MSQPTPEQRVNSDRMLEESLLDQRRLTELGLVDLTQRWIQQPDRHPLRFGEGLPLEQSIKGFPEDAFHGVVVINPTGRTLQLGLNVGAAIGSGLFIPAGFMLVWPGQYANLSILADQAIGPAETVTVLRLRYPPSEAQLFAIGPQATQIVAPTSPRSVNVAGASVQVLAANPNRKGLSIVAGAAAVSLGLGAVAIVGDDITLAANGSWDGMIGPVLWRGEVTAIAGEATKIAVVEV